MLKKENFTGKNIAFFLILVFAIAVSFWGISALLLAAGAPLAVALAGGLVFDLLALWLGHEAVEVALSEESATGHEMVTYLVVAASMYLNWLHADLAGMSDPLPYVMTLFPLAAGLLFHFFLKRQSKKARREQDRVVNRNPVIGRLTWLRYPGQAFSVWSKSVKSNIDRASTQIPTYDSAEIEKPINVGPAIVGEPIKEKPKATQKVLVPAMNEDSKPATFAEVKAEDPFKQPMGFRAELPEYVKEAKANGSAITKACVDNGIVDAQQIREYAVERIGKDIEIKNIQKYVHKWNSN